jgi:hypothetical protein
VKTGCAVVGSHDDFTSDLYDGWLIDDQSMPEDPNLGDLFDMDGNTAICPECSPHQEELRLPILGQEALL